MIVPSGLAMQAADESETVGAAIHDPSQAALGDRLLALGLVNRIQLAYARQKLEVTGERLSQALLRLGMVGEPELMRTLAASLGFDYVSADASPPPDRRALDLFRRESCLKASMLPLGYVEAGGRRWLKLLVGEVDHATIRALVRRRTGMDVQFALTEPSRLPALIVRAYPDGVIDARTGFDRAQRNLLLDGQGALSMEDLVQRLLALAVAERASDIHLQPESQSLHVALRIDGVLTPVVALERSLARLVSAIKVLASMDISDTLRPQDGRFSASIQDRAFDIRVSTSVSSFGESVVMRLLPKGMFVSGLGELGFLPRHLPVIDTMFAQPYGILLMCGPTGSGKTTTLYAGLKPHGMSGKSILTVEDPIEYDLPAAIQTQVNRRAGYTFDSAIRHFLRHDPDIMLVGEIRDEETAKAASRAAETGHLVLSTLHVNSVFGVPSRLAALGVSPQSAAENLVGAISQRLARRLCSVCRVRVPAHEPRMPQALRQRLPADADTWAAAGCESCRGSGYSGRLPLYEILVFDADVAAWIEAGARLGAARQALGPGNHVSAVSVAAERILAGETSVEEYVRLFGMSEPPALAED